MVKGLFWVEVCRGMFIFGDGGWRLINLGCGDWWWVYSVWWWVVAVSSGFILSSGG